MAVISSDDSKLACYYYYYYYCVISYALVVCLSVRPVVGRSIFVAAVVVWLRERCA
jgi:hypothetical protein